MSRGVVLNQLECYSFYAPLRTTFLLEGCNAARASGDTLHMCALKAPADFDMHAWMFALRVQV